MINLYPVSIEHILPSKPMTMPVLAVYISINILSQINLFSNGRHIRRSGLQCVPVEVGRFPEFHLSSLWCSLEILKFK